MTTCPYCPHPATMTIVSIPHRVCLEHAIEFWTGLLAYTRDRSGPCVKDETLCACPVCEEASASQRRTAALVCVSRSPGDHEGFKIGLAS